MASEDGMGAWGSRVPGYRRAERLSHALYGLIIVTATLVAEQSHVTEASHALGLLLGTALVLVLAHTYSAVIAERTVEGHGLGSVGRRLVVEDNLPVLFAIIVPALLFILFVSSFLGSVVGISAMLIGGKGMKHALPFGPFLAGAAVIYMLWGYRVAPYFLGVY